MDTGLKDKPQSAGAPQPPQKKPEKKNVQRKKREKPARGQSLTTRAGNYFYKLGYFIEVKAITFRGNLEAFWRSTVKLVKRQWKRFSTWIAGGFARAGRDLSNTFSRLSSFWGNMRAGAKERKGFTEKRKFVFAYIKQGLQKYNGLLKDLGDWLLPLGAGAVFLITVGTVLSGNYVLQVDFGGDNIAYVQNEAVFESAQQLVRSRMVYANDEESWAFTPTLSVAVVDKDELMESRTLVDSILTYSGEEIVDAAGLYVDGVFYGATTQGSTLQADLDKLLDPYRDASDESMRVEFVEDVSVVPGIYLNENVLPYSELVNLFSSEVAGQQTYSVQQGDNPSLVASRHDITLSEFYAMNPSLEGGRFDIGQIVVVSQAKAFLQVKRIYTRERYESIAFSSTVEYSSSLEFGKTQAKVAGVAGERRIVEEFTEIDGIVVDVAQIENVVTREPVTQQNLVGTYISSSGINVQPGSGVLMFPVPNNNGLSRGWQGAGGSIHNGLDIRAGYGVPIVAAENGVVTRALYTSVGYGIYCILDHGGGLQTLYGHCSSLAVSYGQYVSKGQVIAYIGSTGNSTGNHCHFEVMVNGVRVNPYNYLG